MSHPDPSLVAVRTLADHPLTRSGRAEVRMVAPGIAREQFMAELMELAASGRKPTPEEMTAFYARHDQVMVSE